MGDFPRPFSMGKTKSKTSKAGANAYNKASKLMKFAAEVKLMKNAAADTARQVVKKALSERTKEMGGPNMETPLEGNAFTKAMADNDGNYKAAKQQLEGSGIKMISTAMPGVDPMTGMVQPNQFSPSPMNPAALGNLQTENITGQQVPGSFNRVLPTGMYNNAQEAITAKTNSRMAQALGGALSPFSQSTYGMLGAKTSKEAAEAERKRKEAQKKAKEEKEKKDKKNNKK